MFDLLTPPQPISRLTLAAQLKAFARDELGFDLVGIAPTHRLERAEHVRRWLDDGHAGSMEYLGRRYEERVEPDRYFPSVRSAICVALNYYTKLEAVPEAERADHGKIARYALGDDYHDVIKSRLHRLADFLRSREPAAQTRVGVDTAPISERELASRAGIGWIGKNTLLINRHMGSFVLLGEVLTTIDLPVDQPETDHCGTCTNCIDACPTHAITAPYQLDARRCISYLTIEQREPIAPEFHAKIGGWLYGCDVCQDVCPHNSKSIESRDSAMKPRFPTGTLNVDHVQNWSDEDYRRSLRGTAMKRVKLPMLKRNAAIVRGNLNAGRNDVEYNVSEASEGGASG